LTKRIETILDEKKKLEEENKEHSLKNGNLQTEILKHLEKITEMSTKHTSVKSELKEMRESEQKAQLRVQRSRKN